MPMLHLSFNIALLQLLLITCTETEEKKSSKLTASRSGSLLDAVTSLPGLDGPLGVQFSGYASVFGEQNPKMPEVPDEEIFYWFVGAKDQDYTKRPTILWSNGGPGASSFWGFFLENGPFEISGPKDKVRLTHRPHAWSDFANFMIFEHPLSVTLSAQNDDRSLPDNVNAGIQQLYQALLNFIAKHPEIAANPIILAGESYAGTYLPLLSKAILSGNKQSANGVSLDLHALVMLSPWLNPIVQLETTTEYALSHGLISEKQKQKLDKEYSGDLNAVQDAIQKMTGVYMTNTAQRDDPPFQPVLDYVSRVDVREAIHAKQVPSMSSLSQTISDRYKAGINDSYQDVVQGLLNAGLQVIVISGLNDAKDCNFIGTGAWLKKLSGDVAAKFHASVPTPWKVGSSVLGSITDSEVVTLTDGENFHDSRGLSWVKVLNAGHMSPRDQPLLIDLILEKTELSQEAPSDTDHAVDSTNRDSTKTQALAALCVAAVLLVLIVLFWCRRAGIKHDARQVQVTELGGIRQNAALAMLSDNHPQHGNY